MNFLKCANLNARTFVRLWHLLKWTADVLSLRGKRFAITGRPNYPIELLPGQKVFLNREPLNKSDANGIVVLNTSSKVVSHLRRAEAANIVSHLDYTTCIWRTVAETAHGYWNTSVIIDS